MPLTQEKHQTLAEIMRTATEFAANSLAEMLEQQVAMQLERVSLVDQTGLELFFSQDIGGAACAVGLKFSGSTAGTGMFLLPVGHDDLLLSACLREEDAPAVPEEMRASILNEVANVILNACIGTIANQLNIKVRYQIPVLILHPTQEQLCRMAEIDNPREWLLLTSRMSVGERSILVFILVMLKYPLGPSDQQLL